MAGGCESEGREVVVECTECLFRELVPPDEDRALTDVILEHGRETGHKLSIDWPDE